MSSAYSNGALRRNPSWVSIVLLGERPILAGLRLQAEGAGPRAHEGGQRQSEQQLRIDAGDDLRREPLLLVGRVELRERAGA